MALVEMARRPSMFEDGKGDNASSILGRVGGGRL